MDDEVMQALKRHLASTDEIDVGRYQFLNLESVQAAAGPLWPTVRSRVFVAARSIIERRIAEDDLIIQCATGFLVIFKAMTGDAADTATARTRDEIEKFFLGERFADLIRVEAVSERLTPAEFEAALAQAGLATAPDPAPRRREGAPEAVAAPRPGPLTYYPAWDVQREAAAAFFARTVADPDRTPALAKPDDRLAWDIQVLDSAVAALLALLRSGARCAVIVPAGYGPLAHGRTRAAYVTRLADLPRDLQKLVWIRMTGAPSDAPAATMQETGRIIRARTSHLFIQAPLEAPTLERYEQAGPDFIGFAMPERPTDAAKADMERFIARATRSGAGVYIDTVNDWARLRAASKTGARLIAGSAIGRQPAPSAPFRISRTALLARTA